MLATPREVYEACYSRDYIELGPRLQSKRDGSWLRFNRMDELAAPHVQGVQLDRLPTLIEVPTPWHAVAVASWIQHRLLDRHQHVIFRGQSNSAYRLLPSIFRPDTDRALHDRAKRLLAWFLASTAYQFYATLDPVQFHGAAQHYQIRTNLLDFTPDPAVAAWFASLPRSPSDSDPCRTASVFLLPLPLAGRHGLHLILPPPFVERLYRQRGIFLEFAAETPIPSTDLTEIRFPANCGETRYRFDLVRHRHRIGLLKDHDWMRKAVDWALALAADPDVRIPAAIPQVGTERIRQALARDSVPDEDATDQAFRDLGLYLRGLKGAGMIGLFHDHRMIAEQTGRWLDGFNDALYWLAFTLTDMERLESEKVVPLVRQNLTLARSYVRLGRTGTSRAFQQHLDVVATAIAEVEREAAVPKTG